MDALETPDPGQTASPSGRGAPPPLGWAPPGSRGPGPAPRLIPVLRSPFAGERGVTELSPWPRVPADPRAVCARGVQSPGL